MVTNFNGHCNTNDGFKIAITLERLWVGEQNHP